MSTSVPSRAAFRAPGTALLLALVVALGLGCAGRAHLVRHDLTPSELDALVDSTPARTLLADLLARRSPPPTLVARARARPPDVVQEFETGAGDDLPERAPLRELSREISLDYAALSFARALGADAASRAVQGAFYRALEEGPASAAEALRAPGAFPYTVLFAPSWMYRSHPETGADFGPQRALLERLGIASRLIATAESASVEDNAEAIAAAVRVASGEDDRRLVLVSASKSGAEVALALSRVLTAAESRRVVAWVNIVGALRGTPLADAALRPPLSWLARAVFWLRGWDFAGLASMATATSRERLRGGRMPGSIAVVNVVAVPLSGTIGVKVWSGYHLLRRHGPNDGVVLLADTVWPGGVNVVAIGPDHLFAPRESEAQTLALLRALDAAIQLRHPPTRAAHGPGRTPALADRD